MCTRIGVILAIVVGVAMFAASPVVAQVGASMQTAWGDPDLQGTWSYASLTPLERPTSMAAQEFFTPEQAAERNYAVTLDQPDIPGSVGSYNALWFARGEVQGGELANLALNIRGRFLHDPGGAMVCPGAVPKWIER